MDTAGLVEIPYRKSVLFLTFSEFSADIKRGWRILRRSKQAQREPKAHEVAGKRRLKMLGIPEMEP